MPLLFPTPEMAISAAELSYPRPHPALRWKGLLDYMIGTYHGACGHIGWERSSRSEAWAGFAIVWDGNQITSIDEADDAAPSCVSLRDFGQPRMAQDTPH